MGSLNSLLTGAKKMQETGHTVYPPYTRNKNAIHLPMAKQRQHILLVYFRTCVGPVKGLKYRTTIKRATK